MRACSRSRRRCSSPRRASARAFIAACSWIMSGSNGLTPNGELIGEFRIVGLLTSTAYTRSTRTIPYVRRKVDEVMTRAGFNSARPFRQGAGQYPGNLSARRAVPDRRGHALSILRSRPCSSRSGRACACWRAATDSTASCRCWSMCRATALDADVSREIGEFLAGMYKGHVSGLHAVLPGRLAGARAFHHRALGGAGRRSATARARIWRRRDRAHLGRCAAGTACARPRQPQVQATIRALPAGVFGGLSRPLFAGDCARGYPHHRGLSPRAAAQHRFPCALRRAGHGRRPEGLELRPRRSRCPSACRCWRIWASRWSTSAPSRSARRADRRASSGCTTWRWKAPTASRSTSTQPKQALESCFLVVMRGVAENDGYNALVLTAGLGWRDVALIRSISRFLRQVRIAVLAGLHVEDACASTPASPRRLVESVPRPASIRAPTRRRPRVNEKTRSPPRSKRRSKGAEPRRGPHPAALRQRRAVRDPHQFLPDRRGRAAEAADRDQIREPQARPPAGAAAALRDLRLFAAGRGRASALRQGRARRHPLVRPAAGFPHRSARAS